jgi:hypothetical protein
VLERLWVDHDSLCWIPYGDSHGLWEGLELPLQKMLLGRVLLDLFCHRPNASLFAPSTHHTDDKLMLEMGFSYYPKARGSIAPFFHMSSTTLQQRLVALELISREKPLHPLVARP